MGRRLRCRVCLRLANLQCLLATASPSPDYSGHNGVQILNHSDSHLDTLSPVGFVHPRLAVLFQPLPSDPPPHARCKDKFLVQSAFITPDEEMRTLAEMVSERVQQAVRASLTKDPSLSHTNPGMHFIFLLVPMRQTSPLPNPRDLSTVSSRLSLPPPDHPLIHLFLLQSLLDLLPIVGANGEDQQDRHPGTKGKVRVPTFRGRLRGSERDPRGKRGGARRSKSDGRFGESVVDAIPGDRIGWFGVFCLATFPTTLLP